MFISRHSEMQSYTGVPMTATSCRQTLAAAAAQPIQQSLQCVGNKGLSILMHMHSLWTHLCLLCMAPLTAVTCWIHISFTWEDGFRLNTRLLQVGLFKGKDKVSSCCCYLRFLTPPRPQSRMLDKCPKSELCPQPP